MLAGEIVAGRGFQHDMFLLKPPAYPLFLAGIFAMFGEHSAAAISLIQHLMFAATCVVVGLIAREVSRSAAVACIAGFLAAFNVQLLGFASMIMAEVPFAFSLVLCVFFAVRFVCRGKWRLLAAASVFAGFSYLIRPIGLSLLAVCIVAVFAARKRSERSTDNLQREMEVERRWLSISWIRSRISSFAAAVVPGLLIAATWLVVLSSRGSTAGETAGPALYKRAVEFGSFDDPAHPVLIEFRETVDAALAAGIVRPGADYRQAGTVLDAYVGLNRAGYNDVCRTMKSLGIELILQHPARFIAQTLRFAAWSLLRPDSSFRFLPGGVPGRQLSDGSYSRAEHAEVFDSATYAPMMARYFAEYEDVLRFESRARLSTPAWSTFIASAHRLFEAEISLFGRATTSYELLILISVFGMAASLLFPGRGCVLVILSAVSIQVVLAALLVGPVPRYAVPIQPLVFLFGVMGPAALFRVNALIPGRPVRTRQINPEDKRAVFGSSLRENPHLRKNIDRF